MKYVQINSTATGWPESVIFSKHYKLQNEGHESYVFWGRSGGKEDEFCQRFSTTIENCIDVLKTRLFGKPGFNSKFATKRLLKKLDKINPDYVHLHVLTGYYINVELLFNWLASHKCKVIWTLHDCWAFTGHCIYFSYINCNKWKTQCDSCPQLKTYPETLCKNVEKWNFHKKKDLFTKLPENRLQLIVPSKWLANLVDKSFLSKYKVEIIHNTVNKNIFKPTFSDFRKKNNLDNKFIILGIASRWTERKGLNTFEKLSQQLNDTHKIIIIGLDRKQIKLMPSNILALPKTNNSTELAKIYTACDVHLQPSYEETFGMTVAEAMLCKTPTIVRKNTACAEIASLYRKYAPSYKFDEFSNLSKCIELLKKSHHNII